MNKYQFSVSSYKAIQEASIVNEGITVIAGENGSGKSTLSRMLYYMVNIMSDFYSYVFREAKNMVVEEGRRLCDAMQQMNRQIALKTLIREQYNQLEESNSFEELENSYESMLNEFLPYLYSFFQDADQKRRERILIYLGVTQSGSPTQLTQICIDNQREKLNNIIEKAIIDIDKKPRTLLFEYIRAYGIDMPDFPTKGIKFAENGVDLIVSKFFSAPLSLRRAIYVDTPMAVNDNYNFSTRYWNNLVSLMNRHAVDASQNELLIRKKLREILQGDIKIERDKFTGKTKLCYSRYDGLEIDLVNAATGFKSFAILLRLLSNGFLKEDTLLLIDEPEAHLHPQWIVEYANILIQLSKHIGVKIVITSHNPDMVSAIRQISESEGMLDKTRFYLADNHGLDNKFMYVYRDLGDDIAPIFESFNIALNRIDFYGAGSGL